jgi:GTP cyclohydrolase IA
MDSTTGPWHPSYFEFSKGFRLPDDSTEAMTAIRSPEGAAEYLLTEVAGLDPASEHAKETPARFVAMLRELTTPSEIKWKTFPAKSDEMIVIRNIPFASLCNHHIVPFIGIAHIAYVPFERIAGLSKFARVVKHFAASLQIQEELTAQIANFLEQQLQPRGVGVILDAEHLCMTIRGIQSPGTRTQTGSMMGVFADHSKTAKTEFLASIGRQ